ncbi:MAG: ABC transporter ATP-binding protein/permease [Firmicutes bacterium]|nr:ABC transporter ATP-binding protein/permease [Bacillota bacterium]
METKTKKLNKRLKKLISYYGPYKKQLFFDIFFSVLSASIAITVPLIIRHVLNEVINFEPNVARKNIFLYGIVVFSLFVILFFCYYYTSYYGKNMGAKIEIDLSKDAFNHIQNLPFDFHDEQKVGKLLSYISADISNVSILMHQAPEEIIIFIIRFVGAFFMFFLTNKILAFITAGILALVFLFSINLVPKIHKTILERRELFSELDASLEESLIGVRTVQSFTGEKAEALKFSKLCDVYFDNIKIINKVSGIFGSGLMSFVIGLVPIVTLIGAAFVLDQTLSINELITFMLYIDILIGPIFSFSTLIQQFQEGFSGFTRIFEILEKKSEIVDSEKSIELKKIEGNIEFKNVSFYYSKDDKVIFKDLNFKIKAGECVALVGSSGTGKSTLCNLIPRFYDVSDGEILIDGFNIKNIKLENLRKNIGFVHQDTFLFSGTVMDNIRYGRPEATDEDVIKAAKNAYANDFIECLAKGYNTQIGQRGLKISGGQKQRLAIARAFLKNPPILVLDEATSNLDSEGEKHVMASMQQLSENRTTIIIAHRLSTIKNSKRILVIDEGVIKEEGTHEELMSKNGVYKKFYTNFHETNI